MQPGDAHESSDERKRVGRVPAVARLRIGAAVALFLVCYFTGLNPATLMGLREMLMRDSGSSSQSAKADPPTDPTKLFLSRVLGGTEVVWAQVLPQQTGVQYTPPTLVLYSGVTLGGCGRMRAATGPFYCPFDNKAYLDTSFFVDMKTKYGGGGDFAYAYVVAHEIGHHVQNLLGVFDKVNALKATVSQIEANALSVRMELMADCLAGVWAANANQKWQILEQGDVEKALATAQAVGDDRLQLVARGYAVPDSFTHGSSAERAKWLMTGLRSGQVNSCNTFVDR